MPKSTSLFPSDDNYEALLNGLKQRIRSSQVKAAAVNQELILLYWQIGREILARQKEEGWGKKVITRLAKDLKREFPDMKGFSARNLGYMKSFAEAWPDETILQQLAAKIPWFHNCPRPLCSSRPKTYAKLSSFVDMAGKSLIISGVWNLQSNLDSGC